MGATFFCIITLGWWILLGISLERDRSRYWNCYLLFVALVLTVWTATFLAGVYQIPLLLGLFVVFTIAILIVPFFLIIDGVVMIRREGFSLANLLSLGFGVVIGIGEVATFIAVAGRSFAWDDRVTEVIQARVTLASALIGVSVIYLSVSFLAFMLYTVFLQIIPRKKDFDYVIIHGAGLLSGARVSKLLSDRIDKAIEVYRRDPTPPMLIPSGGRGPDETVSEAEAMAGYLIGKGIPEEKILVEDQSTSTYENIVNSKAIIDKTGGRRYTALVTSNYHVYRALTYARKAGLKCTGIGSHVAFYYWPSALIREYIAIHATRKHFVILVAGWLVCMALSVAVMMGVVGPV